MSMVTLRKSLPYNSITQWNPSVCDPSKQYGVYSSLVITTVEPEVPYDVQLVAGNGAGCGEISRSQRFFTREGGKK